MDVAERTLAPVVPPAELRSPAGIEAQRDVGDRRAEWQRSLELRPAQVLAEDDPVDR